MSTTGVLLLIFLVAYLPLFMTVAVDYGMTDVECERFLVRYGYADQAARYRHDWPQTRRRAIVNFQRQSQLPVTGSLDRETREVMGKPRCGMPDNYVRSRRKRYTTEGLKWNKNVLRYRLLNYDRDLTLAQTDNIFARAFKKWSAVTPLTFVGTGGYADIEMKFASGYHGDNAPFDGPGRALAHARFPPFSDIHFDADETFRTEEADPRSGYSLLRLATHEIGHALGLGHSSYKDALMYARYQKWRPLGSELHSDDIAGIQSLYGKRVHPRPSFTSQASRRSTASIPLQTLWYTGASHVPPRPRPTLPTTNSGAFPAFPRSTVRPVNPYSSFRPSLRVNARTTPGPAFRHRGSRRTPGAKQRTTRGPRFWSTRGPNL